MAGPAATMSRTSSLKGRDGDAPAVQPPVSTPSLDVDVDADDVQPMADIGSDASTTSAGAGGGRPTTPGDGRKTDIGSDASTTSAGAGGERPTTPGDGRKTDIGSDASTTSTGAGGGRPTTPGDGRKTVHLRVSIKTPSMMQAAATGADADADADAGGDAEEGADADEKADEVDPYALADERHRQLRERLLYLTQPRASILSERTDLRVGASDQRSLISQYLRQRDTRLFVSGQRRAARSFLPPVFRSRFAHPSPSQRSSGSQRREPAAMSEKQREMERTYSSRKYRMKVEEELEDRILRERCQLPMLGRASAHCQRSEMKHNFCIDMLERGCHQAHADMYHILRRDSARKSALKAPLPLIQCTPNKLQKLKQCLIDMEEAVRKHDYMVGYGSANDLAFFFLKDPDDLWLSNHFFDKCLEFGKKIEDDGKMRESEAHCNVGIMKFFESDVGAALGHLEKFRRLAYKQVWETTDGYSYYHYSCLLLQDVYLTQAVAAEKDNLEQAFKLYLRASVMANQAQNMQAEALAQYNLGEIQEKMGNWQNALHRYEAYLRLSDKLLNFKGVCIGCFNIAKCHEAMGKLPLAVDNLKRSEHIARGQHLDDEIVRASSELGHIYLSMGKNDLAFRQFMQSYHYVELSESAVNDNSYVASAMVGISSASRLLADFTELVFVSQREQMERVLEWKTARQGMQVREPAGPKWY